MTRYGPGSQIVFAGAFALYGAVLIAGDPAVDRRGPSYAYTFEHVSPRAWGIGFLVICLGSLGGMVGPRWEDEAKRAQLARAFCVAQGLLIGLWAVFLALAFLFPDGQRGSALAPIVYCAIAVENVRSLRTWGSGRNT